MQPHRVIHKIYGYGLLPAPKGAYCSRGAYYSRSPPPPPPRSIPHNLRFISSELAPRRHFSDLLWFKYLLLQFKIHRLCNRETHRYQKGQRYQFFISLCYWHFTRLLWHKSCSLVAKSVNRGYQNPQIFTRFISVPYQAFRCGQLLLFIVLIPP